MKELISVEVRDYEASPLVDGPLRTKGVGPLLRAKGVLIEDCDGEIVGEEKDWNSAYRWMRKKCGKRDMVFCTTANFMTKKMHTHYALAELFDLWLVECEKTGRNPFLGMDSEFAEKNGAFQIHCKL